MEDILDQFLGWNPITLKHKAGLPVLKSEVLSLLENKEPLTPDAYSFFQDLMYGNVKFAKPQKKIRLNVDRSAIAISVILKEKEYQNEPKKRGESHRDRAKAWVQNAFKTNIREIESCLFEHEEYLLKCLNNK